MKITYSELQQAAAQGILDAGQAQALWAWLESTRVDQPNFRLAHVLHYLGGLLAMGAVTLFMTRGWEAFGGWGLFGVALLGAALGIGFGEFLLRRRQLAIPAGIAIAFAIVLVPLAVYGVQVALGQWPDGMIYRDYHVYIDWRWLMMELATLAVGAVLIWRYRLPFLVMPIAATLWYMSMDLAFYLSGGDAPDWELRKFVAMWFGLAMMLVAFWVDVRSGRARDYAFWLYLFGTLAFWGALTAMDSTSELARFGYFAINVTLLFLGVLLARRVLAVFGALGIAAYLWHLTELFVGSWLFPIVLTAFGAAIIYAGVAWQRHSKRLTAAARAVLPQPMRALVEHLD